ncbi:TPA: hNH endonuclease [Escherichia coli]|nr:hNH endonuclease [Escherichia coli]
MKQMSLIEMDGFLKGKCIPRDLKVNETNAEYLVRKFGELESKLETALRECRSAGITIDNLEAKCAALAAENAGLKAGHSYFSYGSEHNFEWHKTAEEAIESAEAAIDDYRGDACDGWSEEVDSICWGIIMQSSTKVGERPRNEDDCCDPAIDTICDYALLPNIDTPATDAFLSEVRAQGVDAAIEAAKNLVAQEYEYKDFKAAQSDCCMHPGSDLVGKVEMTEWLVDFAAQLRKGGNQ